MARKEKKFHYIYKTTCSVTNRYYIGMHSTDNLDDNYLGSGKRLWFSLKYHGKENHTKEILKYCDTREELSKCERVIVNEQLLIEDLCINLIVGGQGGDGGLFSDEHREAFIKAGINNFNNSKEQRMLSIAKTKTTPKYKKKMSNVKKEFYKSNDGVFKGKKHSEETKQKMRKSKNVGNQNSQFGKCWITNEIESKKIMKGDLIPEGWRLGRKMK